ncbi:tyrosine-type recombinase/integrase [Streptomyces sp. LN785]|uniref:tyrosine-type recombinase/integrase n=1 Tax=Streptomyces sp. LN785 TaxID=3112983 RepID=UPI003719B799
MQIGHVAILARALDAAWSCCRPRCGTASSSTRLRSSAAGVRPVAFPDEILADVIECLERYAGAGRDGHVFLGSQGGQLRRSNFRDDWIKARKDAGIAADVHFHDLRHTGDTLAAAGASTRELMTRMGHSPARAALIHQHMTADRDPGGAQGRVSF